MDAQVGNHLGDSISVTYRDLSTQVVLGFLTASVDGIGVENIDPSKLLWHVKVDKARLAAGAKTPTDIARIESPKLGVQKYRPSTDTIDTDGVSWIFDLQRAG